MKSHARVVVIGGGVVGVSTLYHLAKKGWSDVVLVERKELTSGSTWHAAGLLPLFNMSYSVGQIHKYSVALYKTLEAETGQNVGFSVCSNIRLARTKDRWDEFMYYAGVAKTIGVNVNVLTPEQVKEIWPLCETDGILGAIQHPDDGYIQPADLTQALARGARDARRRDQSQHQGRRDRADAVRRMAGEDRPGRHRLRARRLRERQFCAKDRRDGRARRAGHPGRAPVHRHRGASGDPGAASAKGLPEMGVLREADSSWYMREEAGGLLLGPYEKGAPVCYVDGPSEEAEYELFQEDLERLMPHIETAIARVPAFGEVGIKKVYNGAIAYTPDGSPIVGPAWGLKNFWLNEGHSFGVTAAGGAGWQLAEWIVEGEPTIDMMGVDPRRFGPYATRGYLKAKNEEAYANVFTPHYPDEERVAARPLKTTPCYGRMQKLGAIFGSVYGWERPNWFAPEGYSVPASELDTDDVLLNHNHAPADWTGKVRERWSFRRSNYFEHVGNECRQCDGECRAARHVGLRQMLCHRAGRGSVARLDPRQPHPEEGRPRGPLPPADEARRRALGVHRLQGAGGGLLSRLRRRLRAARPRRAEQASARGRQRQHVSGDEGLGRAGARRPALARRACRRSPTPICRTPRFPGSRARRSMSASRRRMRFASTSSASSAGSCIIRSRCRTRSSTR